MFVNRVKQRPYLNPASSSLSFIINDHYSLSFIIMEDYFEQIGCINSSVLLFQKYFYRRGDYVSRPRTEIDGLQGQRTVIIQYCRENQDLHR